MAAATPTFEELRKNIREHRLAPVYLLHGEEGYYLDVLAKEFEEVLPEEDRVFNQYVLYAPEIEAGAIMDLCNRFPMGGDRQMVIVKECQSVRADQINRLFKYIEHPSPTTTLVLIFRGADAKGKELVAAAKKNAIVFQSKKVTDYTAPRLIEAYIREKGLKADSKSVEMLHEFIGNDLSRLFNEIDKLAVILGADATITPQAIERNIGISKDYNGFELIDALAQKNASKVMRIATYFASNPKAAPLVMITASLFNFFSDLLVAFYCKDKSDAGLMKDLNLKSPYALKKFKMGMTKYNAFQVIEAISAIRRFDAMSKGRGSRMNEHKLFHELMYHLLTAPGTLPC